MDIVELKSELLQGKLRPTYIFTGPELALQDIYIDKICEISGKPKIRVDQLKTVYSRLGAKTLIKVPSKVYVIRNDDSYLKEEKSWESVMKGTKQRDNVIILLYSDLDSKNKMIKAHEEVAINFDYLSANLLKNRVQALTKWPIQYCEDLVKMCQCNYGRILSELYKLNMLCQVNKYSLNTAYLEAKKHNMIHEDIGDIIFEFTDAIILRNVTRAYTLLKKIVKTEDGPLRILTVLYNSFRNILIVQSTSQRERTEEILGLTKAQIFVTSQKCDRYTLYELVKILTLLQECESGIKSGKLDVKYVMEYLLAEIF